MSGQKKGKEAVLFPGERLDDLQLNGLELIQDQVGGQAVLGRQ